MSDSLRPRGLQPTRLLPPWDSPGKNAGVGCHFLLQGTFPTQVSRTAGRALPSEPPGKDENTALGRGENICRPSNWHRLNLQTYKWLVSSMSKRQTTQPQMEGRPEQAFLQRRHTDGQEAYEKMPNITNYQRNENQNDNEVPPHTSQNGYR